MGKHAEREKKMNDEEQAENTRMQREKREGNVKYRVHQISWFRIGNFYVEI